MSVLFETDGLKISKSWFGSKITVFDKFSRRSAIASPITVARCAQLFNLQAQLQLSQFERDFVTSYIFTRFGTAALLPDSLPAVMFLKGDGQRFLQTTVMAARGEGLEITSNVSATPKGNPWQGYTRYEVTFGCWIWTQRGKPSAWALGTPEETPTQADPEDVEKYWAIFNILVSLGRHDEYKRLAMLHELRKLFAKVILNHRRELNFFHDNLPEIIEERLSTYVADETASKMNSAKK